MLPNIHELKNDTKELIKTLKKIDDVQLKPLTTALEIGNEQVQNTVIMLLEQMDNKRVINMLVIAILSDNNLADAKKVELLTQLGVQVIEILSMIQQDENASVKNITTKALKKIQDMKIQELEKELEAFEKDGSGHAVNKLIEALSSEHKSVQKKAIKALGNIKAKQAIKPLKAMLKNKDAQIVKEGMFALKNIGGTEATNILVTALNDKSIVEEAIEILRNIEGDNITSALSKVLQRRGSSIPENLNLIEILVRRGDKKAIGILTTRLKQKNDFYTLERVNILERIIKILQRIQGDNITKAFLDALHHKQDSVQLSLIKVLAERGDKMAIKPLAELLQDKKYIIRKSALEALEVMEWEAQTDLEEVTCAIILKKWDRVATFSSVAVKPLLLQFNDSLCSQHDKDMIVNLLDNMGSTDAIKALVGMYKNKDVNQIKLFHILIKLEDVQIVEVLISIIEYGEVDFDMRKKASSILQRVLLKLGKDIATKDLYSIVEFTNINKVKSHSFVCSTWKNVWKEVWYDTWVEEWISCGQGCSRECKKVKNKVRQKSMKKTREKVEKVVIEEKIEETIDLFHLRQLARQELFLRGEKI